MRYLKFSVSDLADSPKPTKRKGDRFWSILEGLLSKLIPAGNPDYDHQIDEVETWLVEFDQETMLPIREIGLDKFGQAIMVMPDDRNYGYWVDNHLTKKDFELEFKTQQIKGEEFIKIWKDFLSRVINSKLCERP